jgi:hypothetical protein
MKTTLTLIALFAIGSALSHAQVAPAATGPGGVLASRYTYYALRYGQTAQFGGGLGVWQTSNVSATLNHENGSARKPFTMQYSGGYTWTLSGASYGSGVFQRLRLSQGAEWRKWGVSVSDDVSYTPQSPVTGFSGISGTGEPIGTTPTSSSGQTIYTLNTHVLDNVATGTIERRSTAATSLSGTGGYDMLRYPNGDGLDTDTYFANGLVTHRLDGRNYLTGSYQYGLYAYPNYTITFETQSGLIGFRHLLSRRLTAALSAGPQWVDSTNSLVVPSSLTFAANATVNYVSKPMSLELGYRHGTNGGAGYLLGAKLDSVNGNYSRDLVQNVVLGVTGGYSRTSALSSGGVTSNYYGGSQATWYLGHNLIAFTNYTGLAQGASSSLPTNAINQFIQTIGFGIGFSPRDTRPRQ